MAAAMLACAPLTAFAGVAASAQEDGGMRFEPGKLYLNATGEVAAAPDMARVDASVVAEADNASQAMADQRERMSAVMTALIDAGVAEADIQTSGLSLSPIYGSYDRQQNGQGPRITGYRASNRVTVTARDLTLVGPTLDALVEAGANDIGNIMFDFEDSTELLNDARRDAVAQLLERAQLYADAADMRIGRILEMNESGGYRPMMQREATRAFSADAATPVAPGEMSLTVNVSATFEILE
jgi:uncharacterized protein YggE